MKIRASMHAFNPISIMVLWLLTSYGLINLALSIKFKEYPLPMLFLSRCTLMQHYFLGQGKSSTQNHALACDEVLWILKGKISCLFYFIAEWPELGRLIG